MLSSILRGASRSPITFLTGTSLANQTSDATRTLTLSSGFQVGDMLVAMTGNRTATPPELLSGYTNITSNAVTTPRSTRVQYKFATSTSETITWIGAYGFLIVLKNAYRIGVTNTIASITSGLTISLPDLTNLQTNGNNYILAGAYTSAGISSASSPYTLLGNYAVNISKNKDSSLTSKTITMATSTVTLTYAIEFLAD